MPFLARRIVEAGKSFTLLPALQPDGTIGSIERQITNGCVLQTGPWRECVTDLPVIRIMHGDGEDLKNLPDDFDLPWTSCIATVEEANSLRYITDPATLEMFREAPEDAFTRIAGAPIWFGREELTPWPPWEDTLDAMAAGLVQRCAIAWGLFERGLYDEARAHFELARGRAEQRHGVAWVCASHGLLLCLCKRDLVREASQVAFQMLPWAPPQITPRWQDIYVLAAHAELALGRFQTAIAFLDWVLDVNPDHRAAAQLRVSCTERFRPATVRGQR